MSVNTMTKKPTLGASAADRISNLPSEITDNILKRLPVWDAVRMSVLSKHWSSQWLTLPDLVFDRKFQESLHGVWKAKLVINSLLLRHKGPIIKFSVREFCLDSLPTIWLDLLSNHHLEHLVLHWCFPSFSVSASLPSCVFNFVALKHLQLHCVEFKLPPEFQGLPMLANLIIVSGDFEFEVLKIIFSKCPKLEHLSLKYCNGIRAKNWFKDIVIDAPNLKRFHFMGSFHSICLRSVNLEEIKISKDRLNLSPPRGILDNLEVHDRAGKSGLSKALSQVPSLKDACLGGGYLEFLAVGGVPWKLPYNPNNLTTLKFHEINMGSEGQIASILCLIRSSPNLQHIYVEFERWRVHKCSLQYLKAQMSNIPSLSSLKTVGIYNMSDKKSELEFVKILVLWATALEELIIETYIDKIFLDHATDEFHERRMLEYKLMKELATVIPESSEGILTFI